ncbi:MAG TPA: sulfatase/phosphatase domain-containing protein, partial [Anaerolineales bacterium]|nr:sulfatase/phosphatase domain-containing protein [Anaerolineales bacterium]
SFHKPLVHVPLLILPPGQHEQIDVFTPTSAVDLLPTLLHIFGKPIPEWLEGELLPPYNPSPDPSRLIWSMDSRFHKHNSPLTDASVMLLKENYKLAYMFGSKNSYEPLNGGELFELYNLENDPEELENLYNSQPEIAQEMRQLLFSEMKQHGVR